MTKKKTASSLISELKRKTRKAYSSEGKAVLNTQNFNYESWNLFE